MHIPLLSQGAACVTAGGRGKQKSFGFTGFFWARRKDPLLTGSVRIRRLRFPMLGKLVPGHRGVRASPLLPAGTMNANQCEASQQCQGPR